MSFYDWIKENRNLAEVNTNKFKEGVDNVKDLIERGKGLLRGDKTYGRDDEISPSQVSTAGPAIDQAGEVHSGAPEPIQKPTLSANMLYRGSGTENEPEPTPPPPVIEGDEPDFSIAAVEGPEDINQVIEDFAINSTVKIDSTGQLAKWGNTLAVENNNPGNLKFAGQPNSVSGRDGFAKFTTPEIGFRALIKQVQVDQARDFTLTEHIHKYSPPSENDTEKYINTLAENLGITPQTKTNTLNPIDMAREIAWFESHTKIQ